MGWFRDDPRHEGHLVALTFGEHSEPYGQHLSELSWHVARDREVPAVGLPVTVFQVGCVCGWRSRRFAAPPGARWHPYTLELHDDRTEEAARQLWIEHYDMAQRPVPDGLVEHEP